jgi:hypothetical protein
MQTEEVLHRDVIARISPSAVGAALLDQLVASFSNDRIEIGDR